MFVELSDGRDGFTIHWRDLNGFPLLHAAREQNDLPINLMKT